MFATIKVNRDDKKAYRLWVLMVFLLSGCISQEKGTVILTQAVDLAPDQHDTINRHYAELVDIQDNITRAYKLGPYTQMYILRKTDRLGSTTPIFNYLLKVAGARVHLNYSLFVSTDHKADEQLAISGLLAHELAHAQHYQKMSLLELLQLGLRYRSYESRLSSSKWADWVRSYERFTDLQAIAHGYGTPLIEQKRKTRLYLQNTKDSGDQEYEFSAYLTEEEIASLSADADLFRTRLEQELTVLKWSVFRAIVQGFPSERIIE